MTFDIHGTATHLPFHILMAIIIIGSSVYLWQFRRISGGVPMIILQFSKAVWLLADVMVAYTPTLNEKITYLQISHLTFTFMPYFWYRLFQGLSEQKNVFWLRISQLFLAIDSIMVLLVLTSPWQNWYWTAYRLYGVLLLTGIGPMLTLNRICIYLLCAINFYLCVHWAVRSHGLQRKIALWLIVCSLITTCGTLLDLFAIMEHIALPAAYAVNTLLLTIGYYRLHVYDIIPLAEKTAMQYVFSGVLVLDHKNYITAMNQAGHDAFTGFPISVGSTLNDLEKLSEAFASLDEYKIQETNWVVQDTPYYFRLQVIPLQAKGRWLGRVILLTDITKNKQDHLKLLEQEKAIALLAERDRLSREIHDNRGQFWSFLRMECKNLSFLSNKGDLPALCKHITHLSTLVENGNVEFRETLVGLNAKTSKQNFLSAIRSLVKWYEENCQLTIHLSTDIAPDTALPDITELHLIRILQEAMVNIRHHAHASNVNIVIHQQEERFIMQIIDDGCGFHLTDRTKKKDSHLGLSNMQERANEMGAKLIITSTPGKGTKIFVEVTLMNTEM